jgi:hypothetical protein
MISEIMWRLRIRNRFALAWWAFRNPDNLTMLRHELEIFAGATAPGTGKPTALGLRAAWWLKRFLDIPVR